MLPVILLILKIIGVILLIVLGLLVFLLLVILLVPVRYQLRASHGEALFLKGRVSWLLHLVHISVSHMDGILRIRARLFGFIVYDNLRPPKPKKVKPEKLSHRKPTKSSEKSEIGHAIVLTTPEAKKELQSETTQSENTELIKIEKKQTEDTAKSFHNEDDIGKAEDNIIEEKEREEHQSEASAYSPSFFEKLYQKLKGQINKLKGTYRKLCNRLQVIKENIRNKFRKLKEILLDLRHKWTLIYDFLTDELNKQGMSYTFTSVKRLLKHILPTKLKSQLVIGTGDPYSTGQLLSVLSFFYGFYGDKVSIVPDFENSRFEGKHYARGRIRAATILFIAGRLLLDKRFKYLKKNFLILKEAL